MLGDGLVAGADREQRVLLQGSSGELDFRGGVMATGSTSMAIFFSPAMRARMPSSVGSVPNRPVT